MRAAYLDTSFLVAILFAEPRVQALRRILSRYDDLYASDLLIAETLSVAARERVAPAAVLPALHAVSLVLPDRTLEEESREALGCGYLRGADLWHVACAMFLAGKARRAVAFLSRDAAQRTVARRLGFATP